MPLIHTLKMFAVVSKYGVCGTLCGIHMPHKVPVIFLKGVRVMKYFIFQLMRWEQLAQMIDLLEKSNTCKIKWKWAPSSVCHAWLTTAV